MQLYNKALTQNQIQTIQKRVSGKKATKFPCGKKKKKTVKDVNRIKKNWKFAAVLGSPIKKLSLILLFMDIEYCHKEDPGFLSIQLTL